MQANLVQKTRDVESGPGDDMAKIRLTLPAGAARAGRLLLFLHRNRTSFGLSSILSTLRCLLRTSRLGHAGLPVIAGRSVELHFGRGSRILVHNQGSLHLGIGQLAGVSVHDRTVLDIREQGTLDISGEVRLVHGARVSVGRGCTLSIGHDTSIGANSRVLVRSGISIGSRCAISWNVTIMDTDFHELLDEAGDPRPCSQPIRIGNHVWIGAETMILKGVRIGDNCVIAARSLVVTDVPDNSIVAGHPARVLRQHSGWR